MKDKSKSDNNSYYEEFYFFGKLAFIGSLLIIAFYWINPFNLATRLGVCSFRRVTGLYCPGCGGTRATKALLTLHPLKSLYYNAAVPYCAFVYFFFMLKMFLIKHFEFFRKKLKQSNRLLIYIYVGIAILILQWIVKLVFLIKFHVAWLK